MPSPRASIALTRLRALAARLRAMASPRLSSSIVARAEAFVNRQKAMQSIIEKRFQRQSSRAVGGRRWAALKPSTIRQRRRMGYGAGPILQRTVRLKEDAKAASANTYRVDHAAMPWSIGRVRTPYGKHHQSGGGKLPARPFFLKPDAAELAEADRLAAMEIRRLTRLALAGRTP